MLVVLAAAALHASWNALVKGGSDPLRDTLGIKLGWPALTQCPGGCTGSSPRCP